MSAPKSEEAGCWQKVKPFLRVMFCPCILLAHSCDIYCCPCIGSYMRSCLIKFCCLICGCCKPCFRHKDKRFPADYTSIGKWKEFEGAALENKIEWKSAEELCSGPPALFSGKIEPADIAQGKLGDCWLLSALACLAEFPGAIQNKCSPTEYSVRGKYTVKIYNGSQKKWERVSVDDMFPAEKGSSKPLFAQPQDNELWVMVYEKVFAKFLGGYGKLHGGLLLWALQALTGDPVAHWRLTDDKSQWQHHNMVYYPEDGPSAVGLRKSDQIDSHEVFFQHLKKLDKRRAIIAAGSNGQGEAKNAEGIVAGHAYAVLKVKEVAGFKMLMLRNPWGSFEWNGDWSDNSPLWKQHPKVARACKSDGQETNDGLFWMAFEDFAKHFTGVDVCDRTTGFDDLAIDLNEEEPGCSGPLRGCAKGCCRYWCGCQGCYYFCCAHKSEIEPADV
mmetsp:Transcript_17849/g.34870  ORF Transcript_17849/g.34870 Transcript_17849/m.34870 type:complete len:444 (-) Transcript_17849:85-1416(-)